MERKSSQTMVSLTTQNKTSVAVSMVSPRLPTMSSMGEISFQYEVCEPSFLDTTSTGQKVDPYTSM